MSELSQREWTVLSALWDTGGAPLGVLVEALRPDTGWSRNTVLTYLTRMEAKGLVIIHKEAAPHVYRAAVDRETCRGTGRSAAAFCGRCIREPREIWWLLF